MKTVTNKKAVTTKTGAVIEPGTKLTVEFFTNPISHRDLMKLTVVETGVQYDSANWTNYFKAPSVAMMYKWSNDGISKSVSGGRCEPDGHSEDGAPSWLLALGMI